MRKNSPGGDCITDTREGAAGGSVPPAILSRDELAQVLRISRRTLDRYFTQGGGPPVISIGRRRLYAWTSVVAWLEQRTFSSTADLSVRSHRRTAA